MEKVFEFIENHAAGLLVGWIAFCIVFFGAVIYTAIHFITKFW